MKKIILLTLCAFSLLTRISANEIVEQKSTKTSLISLDNLRIGTKAGLGIASLLSATFNALVAINCKNNKFDKADPVFTTMAGISAVTGVWLLLQAIQEYKQS